MRKIKALHKHIHVYKRICLSAPVVFSRPHPALGTMMHLSLLLIICVNYLHHAAAQADGNPHVSNTNETTWPRNK